MNATWDLSVNCENSTGKEEIKSPLFTPYFFEKGSVLTTHSADVTLRSLQGLHPFLWNSLSL